MVFLFAAQTPKINLIKEYHFKILLHFILIEMLRTVNNIFHVKVGDTSCKVIQNILSRILKNR